MPIHQQRDQCLVLVVRILRLVHRSLTDPSRSSTLPQLPCPQPLKLRPQHRDCCVVITMPDHFAALGDYDTRGCPQSAVSFR